MEKYVNGLLFKCDGDGIGFINNKLDGKGGSTAECQCGNDTFRVVFGMYYCGGICTKCGNESELYSG